MNSFKPLLAAALFSSLSANAQAQAIESVTMTSDTADLVFTVRADKPLDMPTVRTSEGQVRVRFPDADAPQSIQVAGDGAAIKLVDVRGGSHDSVMMRLDLGANSKLSPDQIRVENRKHIMVLRIARDVLPPLREARGVEPKQLPESTEEPKSAPLALPAPSEAPAAQPTETKQKPAPLALTSKKVEAKAEKKLDTLMAGPGASSPMPMLIGISALLALSYAVMRMLMAKNKGAEKTRAPIEIVAQKRIGPRHQLVIVRAFGKEHLLSVQGGNTTLIAANEEIEDTFGDKLALVSRQEQNIEPEAAMIQNVAISHKSEPARESKLERSTGGDMLRSAIQQRLSGAAKKKSSASEPVPNSSDEKALSQAVAGLVRLRREAQL